MKLSKHDMLSRLPISDGPLTVRRWTREDTYARAGWPPYPPEYAGFSFALAGAPQAELDRHFTVRDRDPIRIVLAADHPEQTAIAYFALHEIDWEERTVGNMAFRVRPDWCGRGYGTRIVRLVGRWCGKCGVRCIRLDVSAANRRAVRCYEKAGMVRAGEFWRDDPALAAIDVAKPEHDALRPHLRVQDGMPQVRFWWMEMKPG